MSSSSSTPKLSTSDDLLICTACGAQYDIEAASEGGRSKNECRICDDPRQYVPPSGQSFTTLHQLRDKGHKNNIQPSQIDDGVWEIWTEPKARVTIALYSVGIGQRACLIKTPHGNVLWDLVAFLDEKTVEEIAALGGISLIVISHPHFYTTWADWSATFHCPVYMSRLDSVWANRTSPPPTGAQLKVLSDPYTEIVPGITAAICGGHFDGSMVLYSSYHKSLFVADTILAVPSAHNPDPGKPGVVSYAFMWSIPNSIPLSPDKILGIWRALKVFDFEKTYGVFAVSSNVKQGEGQRMSLKARVLESAKVVAKCIGVESHGIFQESV